MSFKTLPAVGAPKGQRIGVFGDLGQTANSSTTIAHLITNNPDIILMVGDFTYAGVSMSNGIFSGPQRGNNTVWHLLKGMLNNSGSVAIVASKINRTVRILSSYCPHSSWKCSF